MSLGSVPSNSIRVSLGTQEAKTLTKQQSNPTQTKTNWVCVHSMDMRDKEAAKTTLDNKVQVADTKTLKKEIKVAQTALGIRKAEIKSRLLEFKAMAAKTDSSDEVKNRFLEKNIASLSDELKKVKHELKKMDNFARLGPTLSRIVISVKNAFKDKSIQKKLYIDAKAEIHSSIKSITISHLTSESLHLYKSGTVHSKEGEIAFKETWKGREAMGRDENGNMMYVFGHIKKANLHGVNVAKQFADDIIRMGSFKVGNETYVPSDSNPSITSEKIVKELDRMFGPQLVNISNTFVQTMLGDITSYFYNITRLEENSDTREIWPKGGAQHWSISEENGKISISMKTHYSFIRNETGDNMGTVSVEREITLKRDAEGKVDPNTVEIIDTYSPFNLK